MTFYLNLETHVDSWKSGAFSGIVRMNLDYFPVMLLSVLLGLSWCFSEQRLHCKRASALSIIVATCSVFLLAVHFRGTCCNGMLRG